MATYYISPTGNDSTGSGASGNPWRTVAKFAAASSPGDTLLILPGTYTGGWGDVITLSGRTLIGVGGALATIFDGTGVGAVQRWFFSGFSMTGLTFTGLNPATTSFNQGGNTVNLIKNCIFHNLIFPFNTGVFYSTVSSPYDITLGLTLQSCLFYNNSGGGEIFYDQGAAQFQIYNCTLWGNPATSIFRGGTLNRHTVKNNIFCNAGAGVLFQDTYATGTTPAGQYIGSNNCFLGWDTSIYEIPPQLLTNAVLADPLLVDPAGGNFNLRPTSPCIDAGIIL